MNYNNIRSISADDFKFCEVLRNLEIQCNQLSVFPDLHTVMSTLNHVNFAQNLIKSFAESIYMPAIQTITMPDNALEHLDMNKILQMFPYMYTFDVARNKIRRLEEFESAACDMAYSFSLVGTFI